MGTRLRDAGTKREPAAMRTRWLGTHIPSELTGMHSQWRSGATGIAGRKVGRGVGAGKGNQTHCETNALNGWGSPRTGRIRRRVDRFGPPCQACDP